MKTLSQYPDWIADGTFYVAPKIFSQSYTIHAVVDLKCLPLIYVLAGDKKGDTHSYVLNIMKYFYDFTTRVNRPKPSVQEYVRAVKEEQVMTDYHLDRLSVGKTPRREGGLVTLTCMTSVPSTRHTLARLSMFLL